MDNLFLISILSMSGLAMLFAAVLAFADNKLRVEEDPKVEEITGLLPGINCGACGFLSCGDFAEHIVSDGANPAKCKVQDEATRDKVCEVAGIQAGEVSQVIALVHCAADSDNMKVKADYRGIKTCGAANLIFGASLECEYGCIGFGDCTKVCPFDAIHMDKGLPRVDLDKCTGCGNCAETCPRTIISMTEKKNDKLWYVACSSHDTILRTRKVCSVGCIACGVCAKMSENGEFKIENNLSVVDYDKQEEKEKLTSIQGKCPTKVIKEV